MSDFKPWKVDKTKLKEAKAEFKKLDADKSGTLDKSETKAYLAKLGVSPAEIDSNIDAAFAKLDKDGQGSISFAEFLEAFVTEA